MEFLGKFDDTFAFASNGNDVITWSRREGLDKIETNLGSGGIQAWNDDVIAYGYAEDYGAVFVEHIDVRDGDMDVLAYEGAIGGITLIGTTQNDDYFTIMVGGVRFVVTDDWSVL